MSDEASSSSPKEPAPRRSGRDRNLSQQTGQSSSLSSTRRARKLTLPSFHRFLSLSANTSTQSSQPTKKAAPKSKKKAPSPDSEDEEEEEEEDPESPEEVVSFASPFLLPPSIPSPIAHRSPFFLLFYSPPSRNQSSPSPSLKRRRPPNDLLPRRQPKGRERANSPSQTTTTRTRTTTTTRMQLPRPRRRLVHPLLPRGKGRASRE